MKDNILTYSIAREWLQGLVSGQSFSFHAWSGGGRGQTKKNADYSAESYDVFRKTQHEKNKNIHGGPLPPGMYLCQYVAHHPHFGECIFLQITISSQLSFDARGTISFYNRDGFYIHGRGPHGSDGCIIPDINSDRLRLNKAIKDAASTVILNVIEQGMPFPASVDIESNSRLA